MSQDYFAKQDKHPKVRHQSYLYSPHEPRDDADSDASGNYEMLSVEDSHTMRRRFRHIAQKLRSS
jgi:hypothetical protein